MTSQPDLQLPQPPRIAEWLLTLFAPADRAESMIGDLAEEFSVLILNSDLSSARNWYWRQTVKTIFRDSVQAFRVAPLLMLFTVIGGFWLIGFATRSAVHITQAFLDAHRLYESNPGAYLFWLEFPLEIGRVSLCTVVGALVALIANRKEMVAVMALALLQLALFLAGTVVLITHGRDWFHWFLVMLQWNVLCSAATVIGGAIVRKYRGSRSSGPSVA